MTKIKKEFKDFYKIIIAKNKLRISYCLQPNKNFKWSHDKIFEKDFKIEASLFGEKAGILKVEIEDFKK